MPRVAAGMPSAPRDRAERYLFTRLPELPAQQRRALALVDLAGANRAAAASEVGLAGPELSAALAGARKEVRRAAEPLASGGRCERAEGLISDRLDRTLGEREARLVDAHLRRCPRCRRHEALLEAGRRELREGFAAWERAQREAEPVAEPAGKLRAVPVPPPPAEQVAPAEPPPTADELTEEAAPLEPPPTADEVTEETAPEETAPAQPALPADEAPRAVARWKPPRREIAFPPAARRALRALIAVLVALGLLGGVYALIAALDHNDSHKPVAPWARPGAPVVKPAPLNQQ